MPISGAGPALEAALETAVLERLALALPADRLVQQVVREIGGHHAFEPGVVHTLADRLGVSERSLHRRYTVALGYGPKTPERILRFRQALRLVSSGVALADVARRAGYADQAHLTNECRRLAGKTPAELTRGRGIVIISANGA